MNTNPIAEPVDLIAQDDLELDAFEDQTHAKRLDYLEQWHENKPDYNREYFLNNREKILSQHKEYRLKHVKETKQILRNWYLRNRVKVLLKVKKYRLDNLEKIKAYQRAYRLKQKAKAVTS